MARIGAGASGGTGGSCLLMVVSTPGVMFSTPGARVWKILLSSRSDVRWLSWNWASGPRKRGCCKAWMSSQAAWIAVSLWVSSGNGMAFVKKEMVSTMLSRLGVPWPSPPPLSSVPCGAQLWRVVGFSWMMIQVPRGARGVRVKSKVPSSWA